MLIAQKPHSNESKPNFLIMSAARDAYKFDRVSIAPQNRIQNNHLIAMHTARNKLDIKSI